MFPTTAVLDDFNRADNASLGAGWTTMAGLVAPRIVTNRAQQNAAGWSGARRVGSFSGTQEAYATLGVLPVGWYVSVEVCWDDATTSGYYVNATATGLTLFRIDNGSPTTLGTLATTPAAGAAIGLRSSPTSVEGFYKPAGGTWTSFALVADTRYASGMIAFDMRGDPTVAIDDFGGGLIAAFVPSGGFSTYSDRSLACTLSTTGATWSAGFLRSPTGQLVISTAAPADPPTTGFARTSTGALAVAVDGTGTEQAGFLRTTTGAICVTSTGPFTDQNGYAADTSGRLAVTIA